MEKQKMKEVIEIFSKQEHISTDVLCKEATLDLINNDYLGADIKLEKVMNRVSSDNKWPEYPQFQEMILAFQIVLGSFEAKAIKTGYEMAGLKNNWHLNLRSEYRWFMYPVMFFADLVFFITKDKTHIQLSKFKGDTAVSKIARKYLLTN